MREKGADIPTRWLMIIPIASIYFSWKYCGGVEKVTDGKLSQAVALLLMFVIPIIGIFVIQDAFNKVGESSEG